MPVVVGPDVIGGTIKLLSRALDNACNTKMDFLVVYMMERFGDIMFLAQQQSLWILQ